MRVVRRAPILTESAKEFALTEGSHAIIRIIRTFPEITLPPETPSVPPGEEKQALTIVVAGSKVLLERNG